MTTQVLQYVQLSDKDRKAARPLGEALGTLGKGDKVEVRVRRKSGEEDVVSLPPKAAALLEAALEHLLQGERVAVLAEDVEISPNEAAAILGMSRPLVVHRMDRGHLPFRYVGNHRRARLKDVLAFKKQVDAQRAAMKKLTELGEELWEQYGV
jgi:excisionase family DNA binding protein